MQLTSGTTSALHHTPVKNPTPASKFQLAKTVVTRFTKSNTANAVLSTSILKTSLTSMMTHITHLA